MKLTVSFFLFVLFMACSSSEYDEVENFSERVLEIISSNDINSFKQLPVSNDNSISQDTINYLFGDKEELGVVSFLSSSNNINIKIYGPYGSKKSNTLLFIMTHHI